MNALFLSTIDYLISTHIHTRPPKKHTPPCKLQSGAGWEVMGKPGWIYLFMASSMATATETVAPTMGLLPMPMRPIIST